MTERPIILYDWEVKAILANRKTIFRRVVGRIAGAVVSGQSFMDINPVRRENPAAFSPYGQIGNRLWVKETWAAIHLVPAYSEGYSLGYAEDWYGSEKIPKTNDAPEGLYEVPFWTPQYRADPHHEAHVEDRGFPWRPSIHMPRWASRLTLEVTGVKVERVQEISEADAIAEGMCLLGNDGEGESWGIGPTETREGQHLGEPASGAFHALWDSLNASRGHGWDANPWVWCVSFKVVKL